MSNSLEMIVWDVQHGNCIFLETPNETHIAIDLGTGSYDHGGEFRPLAHMQSKGEFEELDGLVITHPHADHITDIHNLEDYEGNNMTLSRPPSLSEER